MHQILDHALRRWERIKPPEGANLSASGARELSDWLGTDVCRVAEAFLARPDFKVLATQPLRLLLPGRGGSAPRRWVEQLDSALVETARGLAAVLRRPAIRTAVLAGPEGDEGLRHRLDVLEGIGTRPWRDLASPSDYFGPAVGLNLAAPRNTAGEPELAEFLPYIDRALRPPGDFVYRCLAIRVQYWSRPLREAYVIAHSAGQAAPPDDRSAVTNAWGDVDGAAQRLKADYLHTPDAAGRGAAVALTQILAAYRPLTGFRWLGDDAAAAVRNAAVFRDRADKRRDVTVAEAAAIALGDLRGLAGGEPDLDLVVEDARRRCRLVLVEGPGERAAYFEGVPIETDWSSKERAWFLLRDLAEAAIRREGVDQASTDGYSARDARQDLTKTDSRRLIPDELIDLLTVSRGVHHLKLDPVEVLVVLARRSESVRVQGGS